MPHYGHIGKLLVVLICDSKISELNVHDSGLKLGNGIEG